MKQINIKFVAAVLSVVVLVTSCGKQNKTENGNKKEENAGDMVSLTNAQIRMSGVQTGGIEMRQVSNTLKINGEIASLPQNTAAVSMPLGGRVRSIRVIPGTRVNRGQVLALIENYDFIDLQQNYLEAKSKMKYTAAEYLRQRTLYSKDAASQKNLQLTASEYRTLKIQLRGYQQKLLLLGINPRRLTSGTITRAIAVKSPISGYVKSVDVTVGSTVSDTDDLFEVVNINDLFIRLTVFEKDIDKLRQGQQLSFYINDETERHRAVIYQTTKSIDNDKSYKVFAHIVSRCRNVLPGMYVNAEVALSDRNVPTLPDDAVVTYGGKDYFFVCSGTKKSGSSKLTQYKMVAIRKGVSNDDFTQVTLPGNIPAGPIVTKGAYNILSALKNAGEEEDN